MLAVVVTDVAGEGEYQFERRKFGASPGELHVLAQWLAEQEVEEVVMESTAQYWKPVWGALERYWKPARPQREGAGPMGGTLHLCQAKSNRGPRGRKNDFADGERMIKRMVAQELVLSFVPDPEQRIWRTVTRRKHQLTRTKVSFENQLESLLEQAHIKLSSLVSDLLGASARRMVKALAEGRDRPRRAGGAGRSAAAGHAGTICRTRWGPAGLALRLSPAAQDGAGGAADRRPHREIRSGDGRLLRPHQDAVRRLAEVPGLGVDSAQQIIAEVGPTAAALSLGEASRLLGGGLSGG